MNERIWSHLPKKSFMENFIFCVVVLAPMKNLSPVQQEIYFYNSSKGSTIVTSSAPSLTFNIDTTFLSSSSIHKMAAGKRASSTVWCNEKFTRGNTL